MKALVLAAGLGTRLRPLTNLRAKPSLPVLGVPVLWYGVSHLARVLGITEFAMNLCHAPESLRNAAADPAMSARARARFHFSDETRELLGSSGALWKLASWVGDETLAVWNGDNICFPDWQKMLEFHKSRKALLTMHVRAFSASSEPYTDIALESDGRVSGFKPKALQGIMFSSCYFFEPELLKRLPAGISELRPAILEPLAKEGRLFGFREDIDWLDIGNVQAYAEANFELLKRLPLARAIVEEKMTEVAPECWVPRNWNMSALPALQGPVILQGDQQAWRAYSACYGPKFIGLDPPAATPGGDAVSASAIAYSGQLHKL